MSLLIKAASQADVDTLLARLTAARAGYLDNINQAGLLQLTTARAGYLDALNRGRPNMVFPSAVTSIIAVPAVAADLTFPDVVVAGLPSGLTIARADIALVIGALFDTSAAENQVAAASKTLRIKASAGAWGTDDIVALTFIQNSLQVAASSYRGGPVLFGATDIKSVVTGNGTYNFRSDETNRSDAVVVTGASLELLDVSVIIRIWFN